MIFFDYFFRFFLRFLLLLFFQFWLWILFSALDLEFFSIFFRVGLRIFNWFFFFECEDWTILLFIKGCLSMAWGRTYPPNCNKKVTLSLWSEKNWNVALSLWKYGRWKKFEFFLVDIMKCSLMDIVRIDCHLMRVNVVKFHLAVAPSQLVTYHFSDSLRTSFN